jgi:hypothetical protein
MRLWLRRRFHGQRFFASFQQVGYVGPELLPGNALGLRQIRQCCGISDARKVIFALPAL